MKEASNSHGLPPARYKQLYQAEVRSVYNSWTETLKLIKEVTDKTAREMWEEDLKQTYARAQELLDNISIHPPSQTYLKLILSRPLEQWITVVRNIGSVMVH
jgi:hypothetical protein